MKKYLGVKIIQAEPMYSIEKEQEGYRVVYEDGYFSWSPKDVFEKAYKKSLTGYEGKLTIVVDMKTSEWEIIDPIVEIKSTQ